MELLQSSKVKAGESCICVSVLSSSVMDMVDAEEEEEHVMISRERIF
jgi:hypothetical protein